MASAVFSADSDVTVMVRGEKWRVRWQKPCQGRMLTRILLEKNPMEGKRPKEEDYAGREEEYLKAKYAYEREALEYAEEEDKIICKCAAVLKIGNGFLKEKFLYPLMWRWFYYVKGYASDELLPYIEECKKKVPAESYYASIILLTGMKDTMMAMTREEVNRFQVAQILGQRGQ